MRKHTSQQGFTIIETLIVLAIGGFIMLIVFLAIPALSRNSRNNQRHQDVSSMLQDLSRYELNHGGAFPTTKSFIVSNHLTYYTNVATQVTLTDQSSLPSPAQQSANTNIDKVEIYNYARCPADYTQQTITVGTDYRDIVALYATENGSGTGTPRCEQL